MSYSEDQTSQTRSSIRNDRRSIYLPAEDDWSLSSSISENPYSFHGIYTPELESHYDNERWIDETDIKSNNSTSENEIYDPEGNINQLQRSYSNLTIQSEFAFPHEDDDSDTEIDG